MGTQAEQCRENLPTPSHRELDKVKSMWAMAGLSAEGAVQKAVLQTLQSRRGNATLAREAYGIRVREYYPMHHDLWP